MVVNSLLTKWVKNTPEGIAFILNENEITFQEFEVLVRNATFWLREQGVGTGDRVAVWLVNSLEWLVLYFAVSRMGATFVTINTRYNSHELEYLLFESEAKVLILEKIFGNIDFLDVFLQIDCSTLNRLDTVVIVNDGSFLKNQVIASAVNKRIVCLDISNLPPAHEEEDWLADDFSDTLNILFTTSGTTSKPKLVMHSQKNIVLHARRAAKAYEFCNDDVKLLATLPFSGIFGFNALMTTLAAGKPVIIMEIFDAIKACDLITEHSITHMFGSDEMYKRMLSVSEKEIPFPSAKVFGFAAFHPNIEKFVQEASNRKVPLVGLYGSSEVQALFSLQPFDSLLSILSMGGGIPCNREAKIRIRDIENGNLAELGGRGTIEINADTNFLGYLNNSQATSEAINEDGYFLTNDIGYLVAENHFVYLARNNDTIRLGGYLVNPTEIEDVLNEQVGVSESQVVGIDINGQNRCAAFVIMKEGFVLNEASLKNKLRAIFARYKIPEFIWAIDSFPITMSANGGKIRKAELRELAKLKMGDIK